MTAIRILVTVAMAPFMLVGAVWFFVLRGLRGGYDLGRDLLEWTA